MFDFCSKTGRNLSTDNVHPHPAIETGTLMGRAPGISPRLRCRNRHNRQNPVSRIFKASRRCRSSRLKPGSSTAGNEELVAQIEETFQRLSFAPAPHQPESLSSDNSGPCSSVTLSLAPISQPRKLLTPKCLTRRSATLALPFLQFPTEIRLQIYSYFLFIPVKKEWERYDSKEQDERLDIILARRNLRRVCHQVSEEWDPLFFSTTTITVRNLLPRWDWPSVPSIRQGLPMMNFSELRHRDIETENDSPRVHRLGSTLFQTVFLDRQPHWKTNNIRRLQYVVRGSRLDCLDLDDLKYLVRLIQDIKGEALQSLEEVTVSYSALRLISGLFTLQNAWEECSRRSKKWDAAEKLFRLEDGLGCFESWTVVRRVRCDEKVLDSRRLRFVSGLKIYELQLVFRKSRQSSVAEHSEWMELPPKRLSR